MEEKRNIVWSNEHGGADESPLCENPYDLDAWLQDERLNLNVHVGDEIVAIADLGLWNGRRQAYKVFKTGCVGDVLTSSCDYVTWFVDETGEFRCDETHHDGVNHIRYRTWKKNASARQKDLLLEKIYRGQATEDDIRKATKRVGPWVCDVYGWKVGRARRKCCKEG